jgi:hypothetical protein
MTFSKYTGAAAKLMYYILWFLFFLERFFFLYFLTSNTGKKLKEGKKRFRWDDFNMENVPGVSSLLAFFLFLPCLPAPPPTHTLSVKLENRKQKPSTVVNHAIKVDYL